MPVVTSTWFSCKGGEVTLKELSNIMDSPIVEFSLDNREDLVWKLRGDLVHHE